MNEMRYNNWLFNFSRKLNDKARVARLNRDGRKLSNTQEHYGEFYYIPRLNCFECATEIVRTRLLNPDPIRLKVKRKPCKEIVYDKIRS